MYFFKKDFKKLFKIFSILSFSLILTFCLSSCGDGWDDFWNEEDNDDNYYICSSFYNGTYTGEFTYIVPESAGPAKLRLTIMLRCIDITDDTITHNIIYVKCDDPYFGSKGGSIPNQGSIAVLPAYKPTSTYPSKEGMGIVILFPNGTVLETNDGVGELSVTADAKYLANAILFEAPYDPLAPFSSWSAYNLTPDINNLPAKYPKAYDTGWVLRKGVW